MSGILPETFVKGFHDENAVRKMIYNDFGNTGLKVSKIAFGSAVFSDIFNDTNFEKWRDTLIYALKKGVNYIDTAPYYGQGQAEEVLGKILEGVPRQAYYIATKIARYEKDAKGMFDFTAAKAKESFKLSLKRLKLDYVDVLQIHDIDFAATQDIILKETLPTIKEIAQSGKAKFIGITGYTLKILAECAEKSTIKFDTVLNYARLTMIDDSLKEYVPVFKRHNLAIINAAVNGQALLSNRGERAWHAGSKHIKDIVSEARKLCVDNNVELGTLAVWHSLQQVGPATNLVGMDSVEVVDANINVLQNGLTPKEKQIYDEVMKIFKTKLKETHWENVEINDYWRLIKESQK